MHNKAERLQRAKPPVAESPPELAHRLPPGQIWTERFPILHEGEVPNYDMAAWSFRLFGEVGEELVLSYEDLMALPQTEIQVDIHCVTRWSKADTTWKGVRVRDLLERLNVDPEALHVMVHADPDYETNLPLRDLLGDQVLLAHTYDGRPLTAKHGGPLRLVVPHLYFWKSAKWVRGFEFMKRDRPGFWERNGFHNVAEPFREQRFSEDGHMPEDEWKNFEFD
ncbi:sulfite oxidase-like oxidoreductase [Paenibacillus sp. MWE-103]|uniref:Sulfite oxidase-like oxidoreductase n=1 Tax=Paenibacillus artemisiicola TaxID=1172618 RepID=A0ABS3W3E4_9BACL|nr:sulfite oxidase-like oxidoreductase [Paenibacillus artemisiicola]MBO7742822.1 sulfite oxidase-like oxidoreductase [Paenibacillus artemisiicola]